MTREKFCNLLYEAKVLSGCTTNKLSFDLRIQWSTLRRFEKGEHNFSLQKVMDYLHVLNAEIVLTLDEETTHCKNYEQLIKWLISARTGKFSQRQLANAVGISYVMVARIETRKSKLTIDVFLKIVETLGGQVAIHNN